MWLVTILSAFTHIDEVWAKQYKSTVGHKFITKCMFTILPLEKGISTCLKGVKTRDAIEQSKVYVRHPKGELCVSLKNAARPLAPRPGGSGFDVCLAARGYVPSTLNMYQIILFI
jgi:hypothetical protein